jgi:hypothetical protein
VTAQTPVYGIKYIEPGEPIRNTRQALEDNAYTLEAALVRGGIAPPSAQDLATLAGRVSTNEAAIAVLQTYRATRVTVTATNVAVTLAGLAIPWSAKTARSSASMWSATPAPTRLVAPVAGEYDLSVAVSWPPGTANHALYYLLNGASSFNYFDNEAPPGASFSGEQSAIIRGLELTAGQYIEVGALSSTAQTLSKARATLSLGLL